MACASVQVQEGDGLPPYICQRCISRLNIAFQFKTQCESSDTKLKQCFENYSLSNAPDFTGFVDEKGFESIVYESPSNEGSTAEIKQSSLSDEETSLQQIVPIEEEITEKTHLNVDQNNIEQNESIVSDKEDVSEYKIDVANDNNKEIPLTIKLDDINIVNVNEILDKPLETKQTFRKSTKVHQCDTCGKVFRTKPSLVHHVRIHTGERPYVCHLCQKRFVNGGHLHTHMRTHTGEKNHICVSCNKAFATAQQLTKHTIAIHTSERPYMCTYCPKRFASSSNLNTHIKIHTGEKNFHCEHCGKTFSTKGQLQQHMLVHTGEKAFLCEYCNKRFSQKAHLIRHLKTHDSQAE